MVWSRDAGRWWIDKTGGTRRERARACAETCALVLVALVHAGCVSSAAPPQVPGTGPAEPVTSGATAAIGARADATSIDPASVRSIDLAGILAYADQHAPALSVARSRRGLSDAAMAAASPLLPENPVLQVQGGPRIGQGATDVDLTVSLTQRVTVSGARGASVEAAKRFQELTEAEIEDVRWAVHCDVHAAYHAALVSRERAELMAAGVAFQEDVLAIVRRQITAGQSSPLTQPLAEVELAQARQQSLEADQAYLAARLALAELSGWPVTNPPTPEGELESPHELPPADALFAKAREQLPALRVYGAAVREAEARAGAEDRRAWPEPTVGVQVTREGSVTSEPATIIVQGIVGIPLPLWQRNQGPAAQARADVTIASAQKASGEAVLLARIAQHRSAVASAAARVRAYSADVLPRLQDNLKLVRRAFDLGEVGLLDVSIARDRFFRIQLDALGAHGDYFAAIAALERTVGVDLWTDTHAGEVHR